MDTIELLNSGGMNGAATFQGGACDNDATPTAVAGGVKTFDDANGGYTFPADGRKRRIRHALVTVGASATRIAVYIRHQGRDHLVYEDETAGMSGVALHRNDLPFVPPGATLRFVTDSLNGSKVYFEFDRPVITSEV